MKKLLVLLHLSPLAFTDEVETRFVMSCKITDQVLLQSVDGIPKRYSGFQEGLEVGDNANLIFTFKEYTAIGSYSLLIENEDMLLNILLNGFMSESIPNGLSYKWMYEDQYIQEDWFSLSWRSIEMNAKRYYKNDWHFMLVSSPDVGAAGAIMTANCMQMPKEWDDVLEKIKLLDKDKWGIQKSE